MTEIIRISNFLKFVLFADAATCIGTGSLLAAGGGFLESYLGLPVQIMLYSGLSLFPFAAFLIYLATRKSISKTAMWIVIALNALWTIDSLLLLLSGWVEPTTFGYAFVIFQAIGVAIFADLEYIGLRKAEVIGFQDTNETV